MAMAMRMMKGGPSMVGSFARFCAVAGAYVRYSTAAAASATTRTVTTTVTTPPGLTIPKVLLASTKDCTYIHLQLAIELLRRAWSNPERLVVVRPCDPSFLESVDIYFDVKAAAIASTTPGILAQIKACNNILKVQFPLKCANGTVELIEAYRAQHSHHRLPGSCEDEEL